MPTHTASLRITALVVALFSLCASANELPWQRFENRNFVAFSNADAEVALELLAELEYVRAAVAQVPEFVIPIGRPKTIVLMPATEEAFARLTALPTVSGFAQQLRDGAAIVLPAEGDRENIAIIIRHEFAHTMLFNEFFVYPQWYAEGFAEVVSAIEVDKRRNRFSIGQQPQRYGRRGRGGIARRGLRSIRPAIPWETLVAPGFDAHSLMDVDLIQSAYEQDWLLFHYLTLDTENDRASQLDHYFSIVNSGSDATEAFATAFGMPPTALWESALQTYSRNPPVTRMDFSPSELDLAFSADPADPAEVGRFLRYFEDKATAQRPDLPDISDLSVLHGPWDQLTDEDQCKNAMDISYDGAHVQLEGFYSGGDGVDIPGIFEVRPAEQGYDLINITDQRFDNVFRVPDYRLRVRSENVFCFDRLPVGRSCSSIFQRCGRPDPQ